MISSPSIADINGDGQLELLFTSWDGKLYCVDHTGAELWSLLLAGPNGETGQVYSTPALVNLDGNPATLEVVVGCGAGYAWGRVYCVASDGNVLATYDTQYNVWAAPLVTDLEGDGVLEIIVGERSGFYDDARIYCINIHSALTGISLVEKWSIGILPYQTTASVLTAAASADINGDGIEEIALTTFSATPAILLNHDGELVWNSPMRSPYSYRTPTIADLNHDGDLDVLVAASARLYDLHAANGFRRWQSRIRLPISSSPSVADLLNDDGLLETVFGQSYSQPGTPDLYMVNHEGQMLWAVDLPGDRAYASPAIGDLDGDGDLEIVAATYELNGPGHVQALDARGHLLWSTVIPNGVYSSPALADLDGDGFLEIAFGSHDHNLYVLNWMGETFSPQGPANPHDLAPWPVFLHDNQRTSFYPILGTPRGPSPDCTNVGDCCGANDSPGCDDSECCDAVCTQDPFCCAQTWDELCAAQAAGLCDACLGPCELADGDCCQANDSVGCSDPVCCEAVCNVDPFCCDEQWDAFCASLAELHCYSLCGAEPQVTGCGDPSADCCCDDGESPFCADASRCEAVCDLDPYCCEVRWDDICANESIVLSGLCPIHECGGAGYVITDLGTLGSGHFSGAYDVDDSGHVAGWATLQPTDFFRHAFFWDGGDMFDLGTLGGSHSYAYGINNSGKVVGEADTGSQSHAFLWSNGSMMDLGTPSSVASEAWAINDTDQIAGTKGNFAFRWERGTFTNLYPYAGCSASRAFDINAHGAVVGWAVNCSEDIPAQGMLWTDEEVFILPPAEGDEQSTARALNDLGQAVGYSYSPSPFHAVLWLGVEVVDLGVGSGTLSAALDINNSGDIVGYWGTGYQTSQHRATLWRGDEMIDLNDAIPPQEDWLLYEAWSVNTSGQIVGFGLGPTGAGRAFLLTACAAADFYCDGAVGPEDLALLLSSWGPCPEGDDCPADFDNDNSVSPADLAHLLGSWGQYP